MNLHTAVVGIVKGLTEPLLAMNHLLFCLMTALMLFTFRQRPRDSLYYLLALIPGYILGWFQTLPLLLVNLIVVLTLFFVLLQQWIYERLKVWTLPLLLLAGICHGHSLATAAAGSSLNAFLAYMITATLVQGLVIYSFGLLTRWMSSKSPDGFETLENILSAVGAGVAMAYLFTSF
jgi:hypothetical protein